VSITFWTEVIVDNCNLIIDPSSLLSARHSSVSWQSRNQMKNEEDVEIEEDRTRRRSSQVGRVPSCDECVWYWRPTE
jgi:hypothetical protein